MAEPFLSEIRAFGFNFAPRGWAACDGQVLPINQNQSLYSLLGTTFGGDGRTSFALPDLRGRVPLHEGNGVTLGEEGGGETHSLAVAEMPSHTHTLGASSAAGTQPVPQGGRLANGGSDSYGAATDLTSMGPAVMNAGAGQGHENMQPYQVLNFCIALQGLFPSRS